MVRAQDLVVLLAVAVWGELIGVCNGCGSESIIYQITVRDFLPLWCMRRADFESLNITDPLPPGSTFDRNLVLTSDKFDAFQGDGVCPYQSYIDAGEISGHPDFNRVVSSSLRRRRPTKALKPPIGYRRVGPWLPL